MYNYILTFFLIFNILFVSSQTHKTIRVTYVKAYKNYKDKSDKLPKLMKDLEYQLICNSNSGRFEYIAGMSVDGSTNDRFIGKGGGRGIYYKNLEKKLKLHQIESPMDAKKYLITEDIKKYDWKLFKESKNILGYTCYKAVATVNEKNPITHKEMN